MTDTQSTPAVKMQQLYRLFDADGTLLYIGISYSAISRYAQHRASQPWIGDVCRIEIETHDVSRAELEQIERAAIIAEKPKHNKTHNCGSARHSAPRIDDTPRLHSFDHFAPATRWAPNEYANLRLALDEFADATAQHLPTQDDVLSVVRDMVKAWDFADMHHECTFGGVQPVQYPISRNDGGYCVYICRTCGNPWRCWYR